MTTNILLLLLGFVAFSLSSIVPGQIHVRLLSNNQVKNGTYKPLAIVHYVIRFENVPIDDNVQIGVEIRGSNPNGGPRGYIALARNVTSIKKFIQETNNRIEFQLKPADVYAGYSWFLRPFIFFADEGFTSTNMMNSGASELFQVLKE